MPGANTLKAKCTSTSVPGQRTRRQNRQAARGIGVRRDRGRARHGRDHGHDRGGRGQASSFLFPREQVGETAVTDGAIFLSNMLAGGGAD